MSSEFVENENQDNLIPLILESFKDEDEIYIYELDSIIKSLVKKFQIRELANYLNVSYRTANHYKKGTRPVSMKGLYQLVKISNIDSNELFGDIEKLCIGCSNGSRHRKTFLPASISKELIYLVGYLYGDGFLSANRYSIGFSDEYQSQISNINKNIKKLFSCKCWILIEDKRSILLLHSKAIRLFFNRIFEMPMGEKYSKLKVPAIIKKLSIPLKLDFLRGLIDADGGICRIEDYSEIPSWVKKSPQIDLAQKSHSFLLQVKDLFSDVGITAAGPYYNKNNKCYKLVIGGKNRIIACQKIKLFRHPIKNWRLNKLVDAFVV